MAGRVTIIGGGVMGLMTAYYAAPLADAVTVLEQSRVGDPATASFGLTPSVRNDYRDPAYARFASKARQLWRELERSSGERLLVDWGCLNLVKGTLTPDLDRTYAMESYAVLEQLRLRREVFYGAQLRERFAPWVGKVLAQLAVQQGTVYDIGRFAPARFAERIAS